MGRRNLYEERVKPHLKEIEEWIQVGTEEQIAKRLGIAPKTLQRYKDAQPELKEAMSRGREALVVELKNILIKKARGYTYKETKVYVKDEDGKKVRIVEESERYQHPDTGAIHLLLKNLDKDWRNDDQTTVDIKKQRLEMEREKIENNNW